MRCFVVLALAIVFATPPVGAQGIVWHTGYKNAVAEAQRLGKPLLLNFWAERCLGCQEMDESFWTRRDTIDLAARFVCVKVDVGRSGHLRRVYQTDDLPAIVLAGSGGTELLRARGYPGAEPLLQIMRVIADGYGELSRWTTRLAENDKDGEALVRLGHFFYERGFLTVSNDFYRRGLRTPDAREDPYLRAEILVAVGWNDLRLAGQISDREEALGYYNRALESFRHYLGIGVEVERPDVALFGLIVCHLARGELGDAAEVFSRLEAEHPESQATAQARQQIERAIGPGGRR